MTSAGRHVPAPVRTALRRAVRLRGRARTLRRWASTSRTDPLTEWGHHRGTSVDRSYVRRFLDEHRHAVHGDVLEVKEDLYASALGARTVQVLDIDPANPAATSSTGRPCRTRPSTPR